MRLNRISYRVKPRPGDWLDAKMLLLGSPRGKEIMRSSFRFVGKQLQLMWDAVEP